MAYNKNNSSYSHANNSLYYGVGFDFRSTGKFPVIGKRVFETYQEALDYVGNSGDTACAGLILTVTHNTSDTTKNGAYWVASGSTGLELEAIGSGGGGAGSVTIREASTPTSGYLKSYELVVDGTACETKIDIPKDFFVKSASAYTVTSDMTEVIAAGVESGHTCLDLVINTSDGGETPVHTYIDLTDTLQLDASIITATPITADENTVGISGTTVAQQLQAIGIQIKQHSGRISESGHTREILTTYSDGIGIVSGATWDCGEWE